MASIIAPVYARTGHDNNFHVIRHAAAACVVFTHSFSVVHGGRQNEPLAVLLDHSIGNYAVDVFFLLSGFLVVQSLTRDDDLVRFGVSRALRIFPALIVTILACALLLGPLTTSVSLTEYFSSRKLYEYLIGNLSTIAIERPLPGVFEHLPEAGRVNVPLWTIKYELLAYASLAAVFLLSAAFRASRLVTFLVGMLGFYFAYRTLFPWPEDTSHLSNLMHFLLSFYLGVAAFIFREHLPLHPIGILVLLALAVAGHETVFREFLEKVTIAYTVLWLAFCAPSVLGQTFRNIDCSYGLYILAYPVQQTIRLLVPEITPITLFAAAMPIGLLLALLSWHLIERPSLRRKSAVVKWIRVMIPFTTQAGQREMGSRQ